MAQNRYSKKNLVRAQGENQQLLIDISEKFMTVVMNNNFDYEAPEVLEAKDKYDRTWRNHARAVINRFPKIYHDTKKRSNLTNLFTVQCRKLQEVNNKPVGELLNKEDVAETPVFNWQEQPVEKIIEAFKITMPNYNSKARTLKGLIKIYKELELDQQHIFQDNLKELVSTT